MNTVEEIKELLQKNKKRLDKELQQSKEAVSLIKKSMHSSLSYEERSEEHTSELQSLAYLVCRLLLEKKK